MAGGLGRFTLLRQPLDHLQKALIREAELPVMHQPMHHGNGEVGPVLFVLALPDQLRIQRRIARVQDSLGGVFVLGHKVAQLLGGDVLALVLVADGGDFRRVGFFLGHGDSVVSY